MQLNNFLERSRAKDLLLFNLCNVEQRFQQRVGIETDRIDSQLYQKAGKFG
ncbi:hypothetical protein [Lusitaniella coriacea]|uniref:hypothetical protein n=1 Tax=Lusitaniella coriacea TaxID=1983105 RepID=UPI003CF12393